MLYICSETLDDITKNNTKHVQGNFNLNRNNFTAVNGVVSQNYGVPQSSTLVQTTVTVEYALQMADKTAVHNGMAVSVLDINGNVLTSGIGGQTLNFSVPPNTTFTVVVNYSGAANPQIQSNIAVTTQTTIEVIDNGDETE